MGGTQYMKSKMNYPCAFIRKELHCAYDDKDIFGTLYIPDNGRAKHPAVILSHGYNSTGADMQDMAEGSPAAEL